MFRLLITSSLLFISVGFIGYCLHDGMRSDGIVTVSVNLPILNSRSAQPVQIPSPDELGSKIKSKVSEAASRVTDIDIPDEVDELVSGLATRVSDLKAEATAVLNPLLNDKSLKITLGTDRLCYITGSDSKRCQASPSKFSDFFPEPVDKLININPPAFTILLTINIRMCLIFALLGSLVLAVVFIVPFFLGLPLLQIIPLLRLVVERAIFLLAMIPLLIAAVITFAIPSILKKIDGLKVANGNLVWCLGVAMATMTLSGIMFFKNRYH